ncbi:MAG: hypothetical protein JNL90_09255 [Planctomycetes bacterium]|nr:hypothetical protein [Planctomycetota bacterium]
MANGTMRRTVGKALGALLFAAAVLPAQAPPSPAPAPALEVTVPSFTNKSCPVMGKPISSRLFTDTAYGRIWICCKGCNKKIAQDEAAAWKSAYPVVKALDNKLCPVSGKPIEGEPTLLSLQGYELRLHSPECVAAARAESQVVLAKLLQPNVTEVGNVNCPVTGTPVAKNTFCLIGEQLVRLSSIDCVDAVKKEPRAMLEKAQADARAAAASKGQ